MLAVALTMGTMNVYIGGTSKLISSLANERALPDWLGRDAFRSIPRRPLVLLGGFGTAALVVLLAGAANPMQFVRATAACFIAVYVLVLASAVRILRSRMRALALVTLALTVVLAAFSSWYLFVPAVAGAIAVAVRRRLLNADGWSRTTAARGDGVTTR